MLVRWVTIPTHRLAACTRDRGTGKCRRSRGIDSASVSRGGIDRYSVLGCNCFDIFDRELRVSGYSRQRDLLHFLFIYPPTNTGSLLCFVASATPAFMAGNIPHTPQRDRICVYIYINTCVFRPMHVSSNISAVIIMKPF